MEEEGDTDTARVLRTKDAPSLRKPSMCGALRLPYTPCATPAWLASVA